MVTIKEKIEFAKNIYKINEDLIRMADTKSSIILGTTGILIGLILNIDVKELSITRFYILETGLLFLLASFLSLILSIIPRLTSSKIKNILFFKGILEYKKEEYIAELNKTDLEKMLKDYSNNIYTISTILENKYYYLRCGIILLIISGIICSLSFLF